jgi:outer membrane protein assembly factor BamB
MLGAIWGSTFVADGKVYIGDEDGDVVVLAAGKEKKVLAEMNMGSSVYSTPVPANGVLFLSTRNLLYAIAESPQKSEAGSPSGPRARRSGSDAAARFED